MGPGLAKTAFGYSANEVMNQIGRPGAAPAAPASAAHNAPQYQQPTSTAPYGQRNQPPSQPPPSYGQQQPYQQPGGLAPVSNPHAATVALSPGGAPSPYASTQPAPYQPPQQQQPYQQQGGYQQPYQQQPYQQQGGYQQPYQQPGGMGINAPNPHTPPPLAPNYGTPGYAQTHSGPRPIEPWREPLRQQMFIWGAVMLVVFAVPLTIDPTRFHWDGIGDMPGKMLFMTLLYPAIGLLAIVFAAIPLQTMMRGAGAAVLGLTGILVPFFLAGAFPWQLIVGLVGAITLIPGLLVRNEYTDSMAARILVTIGVICALLPLVVPEGGELKLVQLFKALIDAPGKAKVMPIIEIGGLVLVVMSLLAWMPGPATGAAKVFAWAIILWETVVKTLAAILLSNDIGAVFSKTPGMVVEWGLEAAILVLIGYGGATVIGKQLE